MVFFTCNACGSSLKKNQVEKHYQNECRSCSVLSCMDCGQDFYGDEYANHTKCISEAEKYQGAMFKGNGNKGDKKQQEWLERARSAIKSARVSPRISSILEKMFEYPNIPRKKPKFQNFIRNSINVRDQKTLDQVWDIFIQDTQPETAASDTGAKDGDISASTKNKQSESTGADGEMVESGKTGLEDKGSQEEVVMEPSRKRKRTVVVEQKFENEDDGGQAETNDLGEVSKKKKKIRKRAKSEKEEDEESLRDVKRETEEPLKMERKKREDEGSGSCPGQETVSNGSGCQVQTSKKEKKKKKKVITNELPETEGHELTESGGTRVQELTEEDGTQNLDVEQRLDNMEGSTMEESLPKKKKKKKQKKQLEAEDKDDVKDFGQCNGEGAPKSKKPKQEVEEESRGSTDGSKESAVEKKKKKKNKHKLKGTDAKVQGVVECVSRTGLAVEGDTKQPSKTKKRI